MLPGPPAIYQTILDQPRSRLVRHVVAAAGGHGRGRRSRRDDQPHARRAAFETIVTGYGLTETTGIVTMCRHDDDPETIAKTVGTRDPRRRGAHRRRRGRRVPRGEPGEVVVRGYNVMKGYFDDPEATAETIDADGWLHTGDVGSARRAREPPITDRIKDMFIVGGFNAYPAEIENMIIEHRRSPRSRSSASPTAHGRGRVAFVVPRAGATVDPDELIAWCREQMANYKAPRRVEVVDALPLNASGKVAEVRAAGTSTIAPRSVRPSFVLSAAL